MCGRFARYQPLAAWCKPLGMTPAELFDRCGDNTRAPRYNIAPGTRTWIATLDSQGAVTVAERVWAFPTSRGNRINVRSESAHRVPEYRAHFDGHRCVVFANGFYEPEGPKSMPNRPWYFFRPRDDSPLFLAGIVKDEGFSILTGAPAAAVAAIHDRCPVIVAPANVRAWLDPGRPGRQALQRLAPAPFGAMLERWRVGDAAKNVANDGPELIAEHRQGELF